MEPYYAFPDPPAPPAYIEFRVGDDEDELGFIDRKYAPSSASNTPGGAVMFWHVDDLAVTVEKLLAMGATEYEPVAERAAGFTTAFLVSAGQGEENCDDSAVEDMCYKGDGGCLWAIVAGQESRRFQQGNGGGIAER